MSREPRRPGARLERLEDTKTGQSGEIRFEKSTMTFYAYGPGDSETSGKDGGTVKAWLKKQLATVPKIEWVPVLEVEYSAPRRVPKWKRTRETIVDEWHDGRDDNNDRGVSDLVEIKVSVQRYYVARMAGNKWRWVKWDVMSSHGEGGVFNRSEDYRNHRLGTLEGPLPWRGDRDQWSDEQHVVVSYTEELWTGVNALIASLKHARQQLYNLLEADAGLLPIASVGADRLARLLTPGPEPRSANEARELEA